MESLQMSKFISTFATLMNNSMPHTNLTRLKEENPNVMLRLLSNENDDSVELWVNDKYAFSLDENSFLSDNNEDYETIKELYKEFVNSASI